MSKPEPRPACWLAAPVEVHHVVRVLLCGEQPLVLVGLAQVIEAAPRRVMVAGTVGVYAELGAHAALTTSPLLFIDLGTRHLGRIDGLASLIAERELKAIVLAENGNLRQHEDAVRHGALGVVLRSQPPAQILDAIERVNAGEAWVERSLMASLIKERAMTVGTPALMRSDDHARRVALLTDKERQVIAAVVEHRGAKGFVVAEALGISEQTLRNRLTFIYDKLGIRGKVDLCLFALEHDLGPRPAPAPLPAPIGLHRRR